MSLRRVGAKVLSRLRAASGSTVVSLTFDDGWANQHETGALLSASGMRGTYYVNTGALGTDGYMSWEQVEALHADGHEIGGHALDHADLVAAGASEARRLVGDDRQNLVSRGFPATSFAYPFGEYDETVKSIARECGYGSARAAWGLRNITAADDRRSCAGPIPPPDPYAILTPCCIESGTTLEHLQNYVVQAEEKGGGWVPLVFHRICADCGDTLAGSTPPAVFEAFVGWLASRADRGTLVRTVGQVMSGDVQPVADG